MADQSPRQTRSAAVAVPVDQTRRTAMGYTVPVIGVFSGALWLGEVLHWQDHAAVGLMLLAIASVLLPARAR